MAKAHILLSIETPDGYEADLVEQLVEIVAGVAHITSHVDYYSVTPTTNPTLDDAVSALREQMEQ